MSERHLSPMRRLIRSVLSSRGTLTPEVRRAIADGDAIPGLLHRYTDKVHRHAHQVTDEDTQELLRAGYSEDQVFEATVSAALGAGLTRLRAGLAALGQEV